MRSDSTSEEVTLETPIVDYNPDGFPMILSDRLERIMKEELEAGTSESKLYYDILPTERARQLRNDPQFREEMHDYLMDSDVSTIIVTLSSGSGSDHFDWESTLAAIRLWQTMIDSVDWLSKGLEPDDLVGNDEDEITIVFATQNLNGLGTDVDRVDELYDFGVRIMQPTYNSRTLLGDGCTERTDAGLSHFGVDVVERMNELGIVLDLSHCGRATSLDGIEVSEDPAAFTHITCEGVHEHPRAKSDEELQAIAEADGLVGIVGQSTFVGGGGNLKEVVDHVDYASEFIDMDRLWVNTDWGVSRPEVPDELIPGLKEYYYSEMGFDEETLKLNQSLEPMTKYKHWPEIPAALAERGYSQEEIESLCGMNFIDYWREIV